MLNTLLLIKLCPKKKRLKESDIALLAPTGRASKKLMETTGISASTIHKYLGWDKDSNTFATDEYSPRSEKYIIVDEVSMIDTLLLLVLIYSELLVHRLCRFLIFGNILDCFV